MAYWAAALFKALVVLVGAGDLPARADSAPAPWLICGPNSLYMLLRGHGRLAAYDDVVAAMKLGAGGVSLSDLGDAASRLGLDAEVGHCTYPDLLKIRTPFIAHYGNGSDRPSSFGRGHFVVVVSIDNSFVNMIDGTTAERRRYRRRTFEKYWSGYVLAARGGEPSYFAWGGACLALVAGGAACRSSRIRGILRAACNGGPTAAVGLAVVITAGLTASARAEDQAKPEDGAWIWRTPSNSGLNSLYLLLHYNHRPVNYERLAALLPSGGRGTSLADLQDAARASGLKTRILKWGPAEFGRFANPAVVHVEDPAQDGGRFVLAVYRGGANYEVVDGATAQLMETPIDEFRRAWSGYVLVPEPPIAPVWYLVEVTAAILTVLPVAMALTRRIARSPMEADEA